MEKQTDFGNDTWEIFFIVNAVFKVNNKDFAEGTESHES